MKKKSPSPANEFLLHTVESIGKLKKKKANEFFEKYISPSNEFLLHRIE